MIAIIKHIVAVPVMITEAENIIGSEKRHDEAITTIIEVEIERNLKCAGSTFASFVYR